MSNRKMKAKDRHLQNASVFRLDDETKGILKFIKDRYGYPSLNAIVNSFFKNILFRNLNTSRAFSKTHKNLHKKNLYIKINMKIFILEIFSSFVSYLPIIFSYCSFVSTSKGSNSPVFTLRCFSCLVAYSKRFLLKCQPKFWRYVCILFGKLQLFKID